MSAISDYQKERRVMEANTKFEDWAHIEIMGHGQAAGFVTTEYYGTACLFRIDTPELPEREYVLTRSEYSNGNWLDKGAKVKRPASPARTRLIGPSSIFSLNPCTREVAIEMIEKIYPRPLILLEMPKDKQIAAVSESEQRQRECCHVCGSGESRIHLITSVFNGFNYYFCSDECREEFDKNPEEHAEPDPII